MIKNIKQESFSSFYVMKIGSKRYVHGILIRGIKRNIANSNKR